MTVRENCGRRQVKLELHAQIIVEPIPVAKNLTNAKRALFFAGNTLRPSAGHFLWLALFVHPSATKRSIFSVMYPCEEE